MSEQITFIPLTDACVVFTDGNWIESKDQSPSGIRLIQTGNIGKGMFKDRLNKARYISTKTFSRLKCTEVLPGDCLVSRLPDPVGRSCIIPQTEEKMITAVDCTIIRFNPGMFLPKFFNYYSQSKDYLDAVDSFCTGATRRRISRKNLGKVPIPLLPLHEQERIVAILDEAFAAIATATANAEKNLANAHELFESELNAVFSQKRNGWVRRQLQEFTTKIGSGATPKGGSNSYKEEGISLIRSLNVHDRIFRSQKLAFIDEEQARKLSNVVVEKEDVLFNITGASIARCCVVPPEILPARVNQHVSILRPKSGQLSARFLCYLMTSRPYKDTLLGIGDEGGSTRQAITKRQLQDLPVEIPKSPDEQDSIVTELNQKLYETQRLESIYQQKLDSLIELKQSILQKAFTGKLIAKLDKILTEAGL